MTPEAVQILERALVYGVCHDISPAGLSVVPSVLFAQQYVDPESAAQLVASGLLSVIDDGRASVTMLHLMVVGVDVEGHRLYELTEAGRQALLMEHAR